MKGLLTFRPFLSSRRKIYELLVLFGLNIGLYFLWSDMHVLMLFNLGFIWNWAASQDVGFVQDNQRYKFSLIKMVYTLEKIVITPFKKFHPAVSIIPKALPAGLFWWLVIHFANSALPWWPTFIGSLVFELTQMDTVFKKAEVPEVEIL